MDMDLVDEQIKAPDDPDPDAYDDQMFQGFLAVLRRMESRADRLERSMADVRRRVVGTDHEIGKVD
jgi:hypothetical protein